MFNLKKSIILLIVCSCILMKNTTFSKRIASLIESDNLKTICNNVAIMIRQADIMSNMSTILIFGVIEMIKETRQI